MIRPLAALALVLAPLGAGESAANGRVERVEDRLDRAVHVPTGTFMMGVDHALADAAIVQCRLVYPALEGLLPGTNQPVGFCEVEYQTELDHMEPREVLVDAFSIDRDEVSVADYRRCVAARHCDLDPLIAGDERYIRDDWPLVNVTWTEAQDFCHWRGGQLPTEAQWERAARGDNPDATWPWAGVPGQRDLEQPADFNHGQARSQAMIDVERPKTKMLVPVVLLGDPDDSDGAALLAPPGSYPWGEGPYGTRDQAGNVAEWTADAWIESEKVRGYDELSRIDPVRQPTLPEQPRVVRGGSWRQPAFFAKSNLRDPFNRLYESNLRFSHIGFRCAYQ